MKILTAPALEPLSRSVPSHRPPLRVGLVQHRWRPDRDELVAALRAGIDGAAGEGASVVFLPEITLLRYPADTPAGANPGALAEDLENGPTFDLAANGREAVEACGRADYDLILMDCQMPEMDGLEAARAIRAHEAGNGTRAYIAALTANTNPGMREACLQAGMDAFLAKPIGREGLEQAMEGARRVRAGRAAAPEAGGARTALGT